jgi:DNA repair protein RadD
MPTLRPFQTKLKQDIYASWNAGASNVLAVSATGSGKTVLFSDIASENQGATVAIAHRQELVGQMSLALARNGVRHRVIGADSLAKACGRAHLAELGYNYVDPNARCAAAGVDTLVRMDAGEQWFKQVTLWIGDEAHHFLRENKWGRAVEMFPNARGLGVTATPTRADGQGLGAHADGPFNDMVVAPSMRDLINMGYLTDYRIFAPPSPTLDLSSVAISAATGDYNADQVRKAVHKAHITGDVVGHYLRIASGKLGVTFAVDVEAATEIAAAYRAAGVPAEVVSAKTPDELRRSILARFKRREVLQLVNVDLFGEGFDLPAIEVVSMARPTQSFALFSQQFGRSLRLMLDPMYVSVWGDYTDNVRREIIAASTKPHAIIIDHVNNVIRHGLPDARREWSLDRRNRKSSGTSDAIPVRTCAVCTAAYERIYKLCPYCFAEHLPAGRSLPGQVDGDLLELSPEALSALRGEIDRIDGPVYIPRNVEHMVGLAIRKRHFERQQSQGALRTALAWYGGMQSALGRDLSEAWRRFYFQFGTDVASALALNAKDAEALRIKINQFLEANGIDGTVNGT